MRHWDPGWVRPSPLSRKTALPMGGGMQTNNHNTRLSVAMCYSKWAINSA